jgi:hypothetical protein
MLVSAERTDVMPGNDAAGRERRLQDRKAAAPPKDRLSCQENDFPKTEYVT